MSSAASITIIRLPHERHYTVIANSILAGGYLSMEAIGLLSHLLSRPDNWTVSVAQLASQLKCGRDKIQRVMKELRDAGHAKLRTLHEAGRFAGKRWEISEARDDTSAGEAENRQPENRPVCGDTENRVSRQSETRPVNRINTDDNKLPPKAPQGDEHDGPTFPDFEAVYPFGDAEPCAVARAFRSLTADQRRKAIDFARRYIADRKARGLKPASPRKYLTSELWKDFALRSGGGRNAPPVANGASACTIVRGTPEATAWTEYELAKHGRPPNFFRSEKLKAHIVSRPTPFPPGYQPSAYGRAA